MEVIKTRKVSDKLYELDRPVILVQTSNTRRVFHGQLAKQSNGEWAVRGWIVAERLGKEGWARVDDVASISALKGGELLKLELRSEHVKRLYAGLAALDEAAELVGQRLRARDIVVGHADEMVRIPKREYKEIVEKIVRENQGADFWAALSSLKPDLASQLADAQLQRDRRSALTEFKTQLEAQNWKEPNWEAFFKSNKWIFGYGLRYQFLGEVQNQAHYGGADFRGKGGQRGEFLMSTEAWQRFTVLVEIKRPDTPLFAAEAQRRPYRSGVPGFNPELTNAVSQVQVNARTWASEGSQREGDREQLAAMSTYTIAPRSILVIGNTSQLVDTNHRNSFELFRSHLHRPEILTFDELYNRARFITEEVKERR